MGLLTELNKWINPIKRKISLIVYRGLLDTINDDNNLQTVQVNLDSETVQDKIERLQNYGFTSVPSEGDEVVLLFEGGDRNKGIAIAIDSSANRVKGLSSGDVAVYNKAGSKIVLKNNGDIEIECDGKVDVKSGEINLGDGLTQKALATEDFVNMVYSLHTHPTAPVGPISPPTPIVVPTELTSKVKAE